MLHTIPSPTSLRQPASLTLGPTRSRKKQKVVGRAHMWRYPPETVVSSRNFRVHTMCGSENTRKTKQKNRGGTAGAHLSFHKRGRNVLARIKMALFSSQMSKAGHSFPPSQVHTVKRKKNESCRPHNSQTIREDIILTNGFRSIERLS